MEKESGFSTGQYHRKYERWYKNSPITKIYLENAYNTSREIILDNDWDDPLQKSSPTVLLSGTGMSLTTSSFVHFVKKHNHDAKIYILDWSTIPLENSKRRLSDEYRNNLEDEHIHFVHADAAHTPFTDNLFDLIETDIFLAFFSLEEKAAVLREWHRILKPNGIITTRDWITPKKGLVGKLMSEYQRRKIKMGTGVDIYKTTEMEYRKLFTQAGFETMFNQARYPLIRIKDPLLQFITARK